MVGVDVISSSSGRIPVSVVIPAHNEERVIARCLRVLNTGAETDELEIVIVCNGCSDRTASVARATGVDATVVELPMASKYAALNTGDALSTRFPRFYVDADVELPIGAVRATALALAQRRALCAAPAPCFRLAGRSWVIRRFYDTWQRLPYLNDAVVGNGVYALSADGRARFSQFPPLTADDQFVLQQFDRTERLTLRDHRFTVHPPADVGGLLRIRARASRGSRELARSGLAHHAPVAGAGKALGTLARSPRNVPGVVAYVAVVMAAKMLALLPHDGHWERDDSARVASR